MNQYDWKGAVLEWGRSTAVDVAKKGTAFAVNKFKERLDRGRRFRRGIAPFELVDVAGEEYTFLPLEYLFWMGVTLDAERVGNVSYSPQSFGGYYPDGSSPERRHEFHEFSTRLNLMLGDDFIPLFFNGAMRIIDRDCAVTKEVIDNLRISHEDSNGDVIELPVCCISQVVHIGRVKGGDDIYRITLWNKTKLDVGLRSFAPFQSLDDDSDDRLVQLCKHYAKHGTRRR